MTIAQTIQVPGVRDPLKLAIIAGLTMLLSVGVFIASQLGILPGGAATLIVLVAMGLVLKLAWSVSCRSAASVQRAQLARMMSNAGLAIAILSALAALPRLTKAGGVGLFSLDLAAQLWTLGILFMAAGPARTLGWRALLGAFLVGFLGLMGLARFLGRPVIEALGTHSVFAVALWVPVTEELCKLIPLVFVLFFARRSSAARPSLLDVVLMTSCAAAGFAVSENASYGRGLFSLSAAPVVSWLSPAANRGLAFGWPMVQTGHLLHSALIALAIGYVVLYRGRLRRWWIAPLVAIGSVLLEHCSQNALAIGGLNKYVAEFCMIITLGGRLCALLLALGVGYMMTLEWRGGTGIGTQELAAVICAGGEVARHSVGGATARIAAMMEFVLHVIQFCASCVSDSNALPPAVGALAGAAAAAGGLGGFNPGDGNNAAGPEVGPQTGDPSATAGPNHSPAPTDPKSSNTPASANSPSTPPAQVTVGPDGTVTSIQPNPDGSTTTTVVPPLGGGPTTTVTSAPDADGVTHSTITGPDGSKTTVTDVPNDDGSHTTVTQGPNGEVTSATTSTNADGSKTTVTNDANGITTSTTTDLGDGNSQTVTENPNGSKSMTITTPDSSTTTTFNTDGTQTHTTTTTLPDGSTQTLTSNPDGSNTDTTKSPDGSSTSTTRQGETTTITHTDSSGKVTTTTDSPTGTSTSTTQGGITDTTTRSSIDGSLTHSTTYPGGSSTSSTNNADGMSSQSTSTPTGDGGSVVETKNSDGTSSSTTNYPGGGSSSTIHNLDGSTTIKTPDGQVITLPPT